MLPSDFELSAHALDMLTEREIPEEWVMRALSSPDYSETGHNDNIHYIKTIPEFGGRLLRVIVNRHRTPARVVTFFFDRRLRVTE